MDVPAQKRMAVPNSHSESGALEHRQVDQIIAYVTDLAILEPAFSEDCLIRLQLFELRLPDVADSKLSDAILDHRGTSAGNHSHFQPCLMREPDPQTISRMKRFGFQKPATGVRDVIYAPVREHAIHVHEQKFDLRCAVTQLAGRDACVSGWQKDPFQRTRPRQNGASEVRARVQPEG